MRRVQNGHMTMYTIWMGCILRGEREEDFDSDLLVYRAGYPIIHIHTRTKTQRERERERDQVAMGTTPRFQSGI